MSSFNIHEVSDYSLIVTVLFVIVSAIVLAYCQRVQGEEDRTPFKRK